MAAERDFFAVEEGWMSPAIEDGREGQTRKGGQKQSPCRPGGFRQWKGQLAMGGGSQVPVELWRQGQRIATVDLKNEVVFALYEHQLIYS